MTIKFARVSYNGAPVSTYAADNGLSFTNEFRVSCNVRKGVAGATDKWVVTMYDRHGFVADLGCDTLSEAKYAGAFALATSLTRECWLMGHSEMYLTLLRGRNDWYDLDTHTYA